MKKKFIIGMITLLCFVITNAQTIQFALPTFKKRYESVTATYCVNNGGSCGANPAFQGANLGTYVTGGNILRLGGVQTRVNRCAGQTVTAVTVHFRAYATATGPGSTIFIAAALDKGATTANTCGGTDETWSKAYTGDGTALSTGLPTGNCTLEMYYSVTTSTGTVILLNNAGANYKASFVLVPTTTWNGTTWNYGKPALLSNAIFASNYNMTGESLSINNMTVNSGVTLSLQSERSLKINGSVVNNGTILVNNNASYLLVDGSTRSGTGKVIVKRESSLKKNDYNYWSSPVIGQNLYGFSEGTPENEFSIYNELNDTFVTTGLNASTDFAVGVGYAIRGKETYSPISPVTELFDFEGLDHNGNITINLSKSEGADKGYNLIGNPYPSNINFLTLYNYGGNRNSIYNKQWFWTNLNEVMTQQGSNYEGNNYATYVPGVGGVGPTFVSGDIEDPSLRPLSFTKVAQGFIVQAKYDNAPLTFTNATRSSNTADSIFFNKSENKKDEGDDDDEDDEPETIINRYWLKFINPNNIGNNILVAHIPAATDGYDEDYDSDMFSFGNDSFFSIVNPHKMQIQARAFPIKESDVIELGYITSVPGSAIIALDDKEGVFKTSSKAIYLKDKVTGSVTNLQDGHYTFNTEAGTNLTRFEVLYENLVLSASNAKTNDVVVYKQNNELVAKVDANITAADLFDASSKLIKNISGKKAKEIRVNTLGLSKGLYILKITSDKGVFTKKVIL